MGLRDPPAGSHRPRWERISPVVPREQPDGDTYLSAVGYATSPDGSNWVKHDGNPIMGEGLPGTYDDGGVLPRTVIVRDGLYQMWYTAIHRSDNEYDWRIGYAVSDDGLDWTRHPVPVLEPGVGWEQLIVFAPHVRFERSQYHMWYSGSNGGTFNIGYAVSSDGIEWTRYWDNPVVSRDPSIAAELPLIVLNPDTQTYEMWYRNLVNLSIYRAVSNCCATVHLLIIPAAAVASGAQGCLLPDRRGPQQRR